MKKKLFFLFIMMATLLFIAACSSGGSGSESGDSSGGDSGSDGGSSGSSGDVYRVSIATGTNTGTYYPLGSIFADLWNNKLDNVEASSQATNGSVQNMQFIKNGEAQAALVPVGTLYEGYHGLAHFEGNEIDNVTILAGVYPNVNHMVARKGSGVESMEDLRGATIVPGATGSATEIETQHLAWAYGIDYDKELKKNFVGFTESTDLMMNRQIDAAMIMAGVPTSAVTEQLATADGMLLSYSDEAIAKLKEEYPWTQEYIIKAGTYENQPEDVKTIAQNNFLIAPAEMPEDIAYDLVKTLWENLEEIRDSHSVIQQFDVNNALNGVGDLPVHPGAMKYYEEIGVSIE